MNTQQNYVAAPNAATANGQTAIPTPQAGESRPAQPATLHLELGLTDDTYRDSEAAIVNWALYCYRQYRERVLRRNLAGVNTDRLAAGAMLSELALLDRLLTQVGSKLIEADRDKCIAMHEMGHEAFEAQAQRNAAVTQEYLSLIESIML